MVKAFNNLSAYTLIHGDPLTEHMKSVAASDDSEAAAVVAEFGRAMGLEVRGTALLGYCTQQALCGMCGIIGAGAAQTSVP